MKIIIICLIIIIITNCQHISRHHLKTHNHSIKGYHLFPEKNDYTSNNRSGRTVWSIIIGSFLIIPGLFILWFNEVRYVKTQKRLDVANRDCQEINVDELNPANEGKIIYATGTTMNNTPIIDPVFLFTSSDSIWLKRKCELYQWVEIEDTEGTGDKEITVYKYEQRWMDEFVESSTFNDPSHNNKKQNWLLNSEKFYAEKVQLGAYFLSQEQKEQCIKITPMTISTDEIQNVINSKIKFPHVQIQKKDDYIYFGGALHGPPTLGDFRVSFQHVTCGPITILCQQESNTFKTWNVHTDGETDSEAEEEAEDAEGESNKDEVQLDNNSILKFFKKFQHPLHNVNWVYDYVIPKDIIFNKQAEENIDTTKMMRLIGWSLLVVGLIFFFDPIYFVISYLPVLGGLLRYVGFFVIFIFALVFGSLIFIIVVSIVWMRYRPNIGIPLLIASIGTIILIIIEFDNYDSNYGQNYILVQ